MSPRPRLPSKVRPGCLGSNIGGFLRSLSFSGCGCAGSSPLGERETRPTVFRVVCSAQWEFCWPKVYLSNTEGSDEAKLGVFLQNENLKLLRYWQNKVVEIVKWLLKCPFPWPPTPSELSHCAMWAPGSARNPAPECNLQHKLSICLSWSLNSFIVANA